MFKTSVKDNVCVDDGEHLFRTNFGFAEIFLLLVFRYLAEKYLERLNESAEDLPTSPKIGAMGKCI
jgi:hypothetical protein